jgi:hypothetical protein
MKRLSPEEQDVTLAKLPEIVGRLEGRLQVDLEIGRPHFELWPLLGAARCLRMIRAMLALKAAELTDLIGVLARAHYETWCAALYVCHARQETVDILAGDFMYYFGDLVSLVGAELPQGTPKVLKEAEPKVLRTYSLAQRLERALPDNHLLKNYPLSAYKHLFAGESLFSSHGRVGSFLQHQEGKQTSIAIRIEGRQGPDQLDRIWEATALTCCLVIDGLRAVGHDTGDFNGVLDEIGVPAYPDRT